VKTRDLGVCSCLRFKSSRCQQLLCWVSSHRAFDWVPLVNGGIAPPD